MRPLLARPYFLASRIGVSVRLFLLALLPAAVEGRPVDQDFQPWVQLFVDGRWEEQLRWSLDLQARWLEVPRAREPQTGRRIDSSNTVVLVRPALGWAPAAGLSFWAGYAFQPILFDEPEVRGRRDVDEHRVWEQLSAWRAAGAWQLSLRSRIEHRYRTDGPGSGAWAHRFRQQARGACALTGDGRWQVVAWDEIFFHLNDTEYPTRVGLDQNRAFAGIAYRPASWLTLESGYLNQFVRRYSDPHQVNHVLLMQVSVSAVTAFP